MVLGEVPQAAIAEADQLPRYLIGATATGQATLQGGTRRHLGPEDMVFLRNDSHVEAWVISAGPDPLDLLVVVGSGGEDSPSPIQHAPRQGEGGNERRRTAGGVTGGGVTGCPSGGLEVDATPGADTPRVEASSPPLPTESEMMMGLEPVEDSEPVGNREPVEGEGTPESSRALGGNSVAASGSSLFRDTVPRKLFTDEFIARHR
jgi:hypothetical protein